MRYSTEPKYRKYVKRYDFLSFARKIGDKYGKKLLDTATKPGIGAAKTASKRVVQKTEEAARDLIGNKIPDKVTSVGKSKEKEETKQNQIMQKKKKSVAFKNNAPFINCISKINSVQIDNAEVLHVVMLIYNLLEYSKNYKEATGNLWNCYRDEPINPLSSNSESFKYSTSNTGNTYNVGVGEDGYDAGKVCKNKTEVVIPLKHLRNLWRKLIYH